MLRWKVLFFSLVFLSLYWKHSFLLMMKTWFRLQPHQKPLSETMGHCQVLPRVFSTAMPGLIPSGKSSKLSANKLLLTSLAWKQWAGNTGQVHWLLKGIWFSVSRLPVSAFSSAVGPSSCGCCAAYLKVVSGCWTIAESCDFPIMKE